MIRLVLVVAALLGAAFAYKQLTAPAPLSQHDLAVRKLNRSAERMQSIAQGQPLPAVDLARPGSAVCGGPQLPPAGQRPAFGADARWFDCTVTTMRGLVRPRCVIVYGGKMLVGNSTCDLQRRLVTGGITAPPAPGEVG
jgi:hypothetical protein